MKFGTQRTQEWLDSDIQREKIHKYIAEHPQISSFEVAEVFNIKQMQAQHQIKKLKDAGYLEMIGNRLMARYVVTRKKFVRKYPDNYVELVNMTLKERAEARAKEKAEARAEGKAEHKTGADGYDRRTVIKIDANTTVYMNSRKPAGTYAWQSKMGARKSYGRSRGIGSGLAMFDGE